MPITNTPTPTKYGAGTTKLTHARTFQITLDSDMCLFFEDTANSMGLTLEKFIQEAANQSLKSMYGL
jgi:hypothetical protein